MCFLFDNIELSIMLQWSHMYGMSSWYILWPFNRYLFTDFIAKKSCVPCTIPNCVQCADGPICVKCMTNYILDTANGNKNCIACLSQQYSSTALNQCLPCPSGCFSCSENPTAVICTQCLKGYYFQNDQCFLCSSPMVHCQ